MPDLKSSGTGFEKKARKGTDGDQKNRDANQVQGFLFCRPLPIADLERWHADWLHANQLNPASVA